MDLTYWWRNLDYGKKLDIYINERTKDEFRIFGNEENIWFEKLNSARKVMIYKNYK